MARLSTIQICITTGDKPTTNPVVLAFNGHEVTLSADGGSTETDGKFEGTFSPNSVAHSVHLNGPASGEWTVERVDVSFQAHGQPWDVAYGPITLDSETALDVWQEPPLPTFEV